MRRVELLKYHDYISFIIDKLLERLWGLHRKAEDELTRKAIKHVIHILEEEKMNIWFSTVCKKLFPNTRVGITDLDKIIVLNGETKALVEYKFRREDFRKAVITNAFQFITLKNLAIRSGLPLYYIFEIGEYGDKWFRVVNPFTKYKIRKLGNGDSRDSYAVINLNDSILMDELEFKSWLREVMGV